MDSPLFAIFIWTVIGAAYGVFFWSLYLAVTARLETVTKILVCAAIVVVQPVASFVFIGWYYSRYGTLRRVS